MQIGTSTDWQSVKCGSRYTIALKTDGTLWTWGRNNTGQLGIGTTVNKFEPTQMGADLDWESMDPGYFFCYARKTDGSLWAWGSNYGGQLSIGTTVDQYFARPSYFNNRHRPIQCIRLHGAFYQNRRFIMDVRCEYLGTIR